MQSIRDIDWSSLVERQFTPSPSAWEDQVLYFVMIDRFSDNQEQGYLDISGNLVTAGTTPAFSKSERNSILRNEETASAWRAAGDTFCGGTLVGLQSKLGYLKRLGITTLWLSPVLKQACYDSTTYHGYGTQNFLEIDPHFGTREQLSELVAMAHQLSMYVVLDIIVNHAANVFTYDAPDQSTLVGPAFNKTGTYPVRGFNDESGEPTLPFDHIDLEKYPRAWPDGAIWPQELQSENVFSRRGAIDEYEDPEQFLHGDFMKLKDMVLGEQTSSGFVPSVALKTITNAYQYWLAYADLDGFRLDAVKHMEEGAVSYFVNETQQFARKLGKHNFYLIGEVAGGRARAAEVMRNTGLNAILAVDDAPGTLEALAKGQTNPAEYFAFFAGETSVEQRIVWQNNSVVTMYDDHDQIRNGFSKARFAAGDPLWSNLEFNALAILVTTIGIPGIYYGSEQAFDGEGGDDNYIREAMFGGSFGAFRSSGYHFFDESNEIFKNLARLLSVRKQSSALRRGTQCLLKTSGDKKSFAWLRTFDNESVVCAMNSDVENAHTLDLGFDGVHDCAQSQLLFSTNVEQPQTILDSKIAVPAAGFVVYKLS